MLIAIWPVLILIIGLLMWVLSSNPKVSEAGKIIFFCGMLITTWVLAKHVVRIG
jgi:Na+/phosphate symporter